MHKEKDTKTNEHRHEVKHAKFVIFIDFLSIVNPLTRDTREHTGRNLGRPVCEREDRTTCGEWVKLLKSKSGRPSDPDKEWRSGADVRPTTRGLGGIQAFRFNFGYIITKLRSKPSWPGVRKQRVRTPEAKIIMARS